MEYGKIISTGWGQAWRHKTLWIFGFLISGGGGTNLLNISDGFDDFGLGSLGQGDLFRIKEFIFEHLYIVALLAVMALVAFLIWVVLSVISTGGLIDAARQMKSHEPYSFGKAFKTGVKYFWRILGATLLTFVVVAALLIFMALLGVVAFIIHVAVGILAVLILLPIMIIGLFIIVLTIALAERYIVIRDKAVFDAITDGFNLWKSNLGPSVLYSLIYVGIGIAVGLGTLVVILFAVIPFIAVGFVNVLVAVLIGVPVVLLILLVVEGFSGSAMHLMTTEFYFQLVEKSQTASVQPDGPGGYTAPPPPPVF